jgi:hypothetical protein
MGMNTVELAYEYTRGEQTESTLYQILGDEAQVANVISIAETLSDEDKAILSAAKKYE